MKRTLRRIVTIIVGLSLGWYAAGLLPSDFSAVEVGYASQESQDHDASPSAPADAHEPDHTDAAELDGHGATSAGEDHDQPAAAPNLALDEEPNWYRPVLWGVGILFIAAIVLGVPAMRLRGPEPPDPADQHDDHSHDEDEEPASHH